MSFDLRVLTHAQDEEAEEEEGAGISRLIYLGKTPRHSSKALKKSDLEVPVASSREDALMTRDRLSAWATQRRLNDNNNNNRRINGSNVNSLMNVNAIGIVNDKLAEANLGLQENQNQNENNNSNSNNNNNNNNNPMSKEVGASPSGKSVDAVRPKYGSSAEPADIPTSSSSSSSTVFQLSVTKSSTEEPFGIIIQGGIDAPYIDADGEECTRMRIKEVRPGGAAARQRNVKSGMEIRRVNHVEVEGKTHREIVAMIQAAGTQLDLDIIIAKPSPSIAAENQNTEATSDEEYAYASPNLNENNAAAAALLAAAAAEYPDDPRAATAAAINAAIITKCAAANAKTAAANAARVKAASKAIDEKLGELERLRDAASATNENGGEDKEDAAMEGSIPKVVVIEEESALSKKTSKESGVQPGSTPLSDILWGAVATHAKDPASESRRNETNGEGEQCLSSSSSPEGKTPSPYRIPTPSPMPTPTSIDDPALDRRRADTPYPICYPRLPSAMDGRETPGIGAMAPEIDVAQTLKDVVEATPYERPMTAWSIHDPTEEEEERERKGKKERSKGNSDDGHRHRMLSQASDVTNSSFPVAASRLDPHSEAAKCKWRPAAAAPSKSKSRFMASRYRTHSLAKTTPEANAATPKNKSGEDHMYLFVGSMTLLAASAMVALYAAKHYKRKG